MKRRILAAATAAVLGLSTAACAQPYGPGYGPGGGYGPGYGAFDAMAQAHKEMFEAQLQMRKRVDAVLTPQQREQMQRGNRGRWGR